MTAFPNTNNGASLLAVYWIFYLYSIQFK